MKKIYLLIISLILFIPSITLANSIDDIKMDIYIDNNGTAHVTEVWNMNVSEGTEGYKPYYNLGESEISNFKVSMNDRVFTYNDNWDTSDSFNTKAYHNGINYLDNGLELCFGISNYGSNTYTLTYDISNFVVSTSDGYQMVYWTLFPYEFSPNPGRVYIKIHSDFRYEDTLDVWGYGKYGAPCYVYDGYIEMDSESTVNSSEYMTILIKFPENTFNTSVTLEDDFNNYLDMANEGSKAYKESKKSIFSELFDFIYNFFGWLVFVVSMIIIGITNKFPKYGTYRLKFGDTGNKVKDVLPFRDIPYKMEELSKGYWVASQYNQINKPTDYLGAILLKWLKLGKISLKKEDSKTLLGSKENTSIIFNNCEGLDTYETKLYSMMYEASKDGILEKNEFTSWCNKHYSKILTWFNDVIDNATVKFTNEGKLERIGYKKCNVNPIMMEAKKVAGLKKFLNEFSNIKDRNAIEVNLWEEYLMYANIFGIAKKVMKEFKDLYPDVITDEIYNDVTFVYMISDSGVSSATTARERLKVILQEAEDFLPAGEAEAPSEEEVAAVESASYEYNGTYYSIEIIRKNNKNTYLRVKDGKIVVTTNYLVSNKKIDKLISDNKNFINKALSKDIKKKEDTSFKLFGESYDIIYGFPNTSIEEGKIYTKDEKTINKYLSKYIYDIYLDRLNYWYNLFEENIPTPNLKIRKMTSRWGVCNLKNKNVTLNLELSKYNIEALDYVIVHELSHFIHPNHSKDFWSLVGKYYPKYKEIRKNLKNS